MKFAKFEITKSMSACLLGDVKHEVKVARVGKNYVVSIFTNGLLNQEAVTQGRENIGNTARQLLRMEDKCGNVSKYASSARKRILKNS